jgi:hypothetical protein
MYIQFWGPWDSICNILHKWNTYFDYSKYEAAMGAVTQFEGRDLKRHTLLQVGRAYLDHLLFEQKFDQAGQLCLKILGESWHFMMKLLIIRKSLLSSTLLKLEVHLY